MLNSTIELQLGKKPNQENWKPSEKQKKTINRLREEFTIGSNFRSQYEEQWKDNIDRYEARPFFHEDGRAGVVLPIAKWVIEQKQATEMKAPPSFSYEPLEYAEDKKVAEILEQIVKKHVWGLKYVNLDYKLDIMNHHKDILGGMFLFVGWRTIFRTIRKKKMPTELDRKENDDKEEEEGNETEKPTKKTDYDDKSEYGEEVDTSNVTSEKYYDDICVDVVFPQDIWLHPLATCVADSPWIKHRQRFDYATFLETFSDTEVFTNIEFVKKGQWAMTGEIGDKAGYKEFATDNKDEVVVFGHWDKMRDQLILEANGVLIYDGENPFDHKELPYVDFIDRLQFDTYVGEGEPQRIATIADSIDAFINIAIDKEKRAGSGINLFDDNFSDFDDVATIFSPNSATRVADPKNAFVHYELPGMSGSTDKMISMLMDYLIFATGVDFRQITDMNASTQATVAAIRREITQGRLSLNVRRNENRGFKRLGWLLMKLVQQYYPVPLVKYLAGDATPEEQAEYKKEGINYKKVRIKGMAITEKPIEGSYTKDSLVMTGVGENEYGFFQARPAYIRTKGECEVRVVADSSFAASRELEKGNARDFLQVTAQTLVNDPKTGQPAPIGSLKYGYRKYVEALGYDADEALDITDNETDNVAQQEAQKVMGGMLNQPQAGAAQMTGNMPAEAPPARLTGASSEPVQQLKAQLGAANNIVK